MVTSGGLQGQLVRQFTHLTWSFQSHLVADFRVKTDTCSPMQSPGLKLAILDTQQSIRKDYGKRATSRCPDRLAAPEYRKLLGSQHHGETQSQESVHCTVHSFCFTRVAGLLVFIPAEQELITQRIGRVRTEISWVSQWSQVCACLGGVKNLQPHGRSSSKVILWVKSSYLCEESPHQAVTPLRRAGHVGTGVSGEWSVWLKNHRQEFSGLAVSRAAAPSVATVTRCDQLLHLAVRERERMRAPRSALNTRVTFSTFPPITFPQREKLERLTQDQWVKSESNERDSHQPTGGYWTGRETFGRCSGISSHPHPTPRCFTLGQLYVNSDSLKIVLTNAPNPNNGIKGRLRCAESDYIDQYAGPGAPLWQLNLYKQINGTAAQCCFQPPEGICGKPFSFALFQKHIWLRDTQTLPWLPPTPLPVLTLTKTGKLSQSERKCGPP
ncbi:hypothetical protein JZ751_010209 [Albula glossodonta]|uniref:Uncharacterized protein n=1 Tax=Albula glossodonta TaxID=121402 RepID=A0A8T2N1L2_9TELE|nr:hypothetical protein JZ751_010209 [Albula glossodonta]